MDMNKVLAQGGDSHTQGYTKIKKGKYFSYRMPLTFHRSASSGNCLFVIKSEGMKVGRIVSLTGELFRHFMSCM
jgi:hypothetical protein